MKLGKVTKDVKPGFALSKQKRRKINANNGIPQLRPYNIANWNKINLDELTYIPKSMDGIEEYFIKNDDVLFNNTNSVELVGRSAVYKGSDGKYTYSNHITRIRVKDQIIKPDFLSWYLNYLWNKGFFYLKATKWIDQAGVSNKKLISIKIPLPFRNGKPHLETQKKIVEYIETNFSRIEKILEKKKKELEKLDELWENVLEQAFKPKKGEEWREVRLGEVAHIIRGVNFKKSEIVPINQGEAVITASHIQGDRLIKENFIFVPSTKVKPEQKVKSGDIVIIMSTGSRTALGRTYYSRFDEEVYIGAFLGIIRYNGTEQSSKFIYFFTKTQKFKAPCWAILALKLIT